MKRPWVYHRKRPWLAVGFCYDRKKWKHTIFKISLCCSAAVAVLWIKRTVPSASFPQLTLIAAYCPTMRDVSFVEYKRWHDDCDSGLSCQLYWTHHPPSLIAWIWLRQSALLALLHAYVRSEAIAAVKQGYSYRLEPYNITQQKIWGSSIFRENGCRFSRTQDTKGIWKSDRFRSQIFSGYWKRSNLFNFSDTEFRYHKRWSKTWN